MDDFTSTLWKCLEVNLPRASTTADMDAELADLGLDSMTAIEVVLAVEEAFDVMFPDEMIGPDTFRTAATLRDAVLDLRATAQASSQGKT